MGSKRPPLDELVSLWQAIVAREGVTTLAGDAGGISIVDAGLIGFGADSFRSMTLQIYPGDQTRVDTADITGFDNGSGEVSVSSGMKGGVVPAGVAYKILTLRPAIAEVHGVFTVLPSAPETIEPDTTQDLSLSISTVEGIPVAANLTAGTITITRVRAGVEFIVINGLACTAANGRIFYAYTFPSAGAAWQPGDEYKAVFSGQQVAVGATTYVLSDIRCKGIIIDVAAVITTIADIEMKLDAGGLGVGQVTKALTFANQTGQVPLFTVTGDVIVRIIAVVKTNCGSAGGCNVSVGIAADVDAIIPVTDITLLAAQEIWFDATPDSEIETLGTMREHIISDGNDITLNSSAADNSGAITFYCFWTALSAGASVA